MLRLGWFSTGRGEGSRGFLTLIQRQIESGYLDVALEFVFSNRERGEAEGSDLFFKLVDDYGLRLITLSSGRYRREHGGGPISNHRGPFHQEVLRLISGMELDLCVLAGYMLITSPEMCRRYPMINLHPALPEGPAGTWQQVIWRLIEEKAVESGVMVHEATEIVDTGPVLTYCSFPIRGTTFDLLWREAARGTIDDLRAKGEDQPLFRAIRREGLRREGPLLVETLRALARGRLTLAGDNVLGVTGATPAGECLDEEVERFLRANEA